MEAVERGLDHVGIGVSPDSTPTQIGFRSTRYPVRYRNRSMNRSRPARARSDSRKAATWPAYPELASFSGESGRSRPCQRGRQFANAKANFWLVGPRKTQHQSTTR